MEEKENDFVSEEALETNPQQIIADGTESKPFIINDVSEFRNISNNLSACYRLGCDLDFGGESISALSKFTGGLDGDGHTIRNFKTQTGGLLGYASNARITNLKIEKAENKQRTDVSNVGILARTFTNCTIENIRLCDINVTGGTYTGGMAGIVSGGSIIGCSVTGESSISGTSQVGGLFGEAKEKTQIRECGVEVSIKGSNGLGGLIGELSGKVTNCYAIGTITSINYYNMVAGMAGYVRTGEIENSFAVCTISRNGSGLFVGSTAVIKDSFFDSTKVGFTTNDEFNVGKLTIGLIQKEKYKNWDFEKVWNITEGSSYPYLRRIGKRNENINAEVITEGLGTEDNPYLIANAEALDYIKYDLTGYYRLAEDIDLKGESIVSLGTVKKPFVGGVNGDNHIIRNFKTDEGGVFGYVKNAKMKNLTLEEGENIQATASGNMAIFADTLEQCITENIHLKNITINGGYVTGGLAAVITGGDVTGCFLYGNNQIKGRSNAGGLAGRTKNGTSIKECGAEVSVQGSYYAGGLVGAFEGEMKDCYAKGSVNSSRTYYAGGLIGDAAKANIRNCYAVCMMSKDGKGLCSINDTVTIDSCYYDSTVALLETNDYKKGRLTAALLWKETYENWDFEKVWDIEEGNSYPYLRKMGKTGDNAETRAITSGVGTEENPYLIADAKAFDCMRYDLTGYYRLVGDIACNEGIIVSIGSKSLPFIGGLDGDGYCIRNLLIRKGGLFAYAKNAKFLNLRIENGENSQGSSISDGGILGGILEECITENIHLIDIAVTGRNNMGGLAGSIIGGSVTRCSVRGNSYINGNENVGGLLGSADKTVRIAQCCAEVNVNGYRYAGGLIGHTKGEVMDCYAIGSGLEKSGSYDRAGLIGYASEGRIENSFAACTISEGGAGLALVQGTAEIKNSYFDNVVAKCTSEDKCKAGKLTTALTQKENFVNWDFEKVWNITEGSSYPFLRCIGKTEREVKAISIAEGLGTEDNPYLIDNFESLSYMKYEPTACYKLICDLDLEGKEIVPLSSVSEPFMGTLDGGGHCIKNYIMNIYDKNIGLFGLAVGAAIKHLRIENAEVMRKKSQIDSYLSYDSGVLAGKLKNCIVDDVCLRDISIKAMNYVGGLAGKIDGGRITNCYIDGNSEIDGSNYVGGLIGEAGADAQISRCGVKGYVKGSDYVGGLIGSLGTDVSSCFAFGNVVSIGGHSYVGGLAGFVIASVIQSSYAACRVSKGGSGLAYLYYSGKAENSYFDSTIAGVTTPKEQARTTEQMHTKETFADWDFENIWMHKPGEYPILTNYQLIAQEPFELKVRLLTCESVCIEWEEVPGATGYDIFYLNKRERLSEPKALLTELIPDTDYEFRAQANRGDVKGIWSQTLKIKTKKVSVVEGVHLENKDRDAMTLSWESVEDAAGYEIICNDRIYQTDTNTCVMEGLDADLPYTIIVRAIMTDGSVITGQPVMGKLFTLNPQTDYAKEFIAKCENQTWFMEEMENILNLKGKTLNTLNSKEDFATIYAIDLTNRGIRGKIPAAIGELSELRYLYLSNNLIEGNVPEEIVPNLKEIQL